MTITFEDQKNGEKFETVGMYASNKSLCPVKNGLNLIRRICSLPCPVAIADRKINLYQSKQGKIKENDLKLICSFIPTTSNKIQ